MCSTLNRAISARLAADNKFRLRPRVARALDIGVSLFSVAALCGVTVYVMHDAIRRLGKSESEEDDVNPTIMLFFTSINLLIDFGMFGSIVLRRGGFGGCLCSRCKPASATALLQREASPGRADGVDGAALSCATRAPSCDAGWMS